MIYPPHPDRVDFADSAEGPKLAMISGTGTQWFAPSAVSLTYAWSDAQTITRVDNNSPVEPRERLILRALLVHALDLLDEVDQAERALASEAPR